MLSDDKKINDMYLDLKSDDDFSDNDKLPLTNDYFNSLSFVDKMNKSFNSLPSIPSSVRRLKKKLTELLSVLALFLYSTLFFISCIVSRSTLLSMTSQLEPNHTVYCIKNSNRNEMKIYFLVQSKSERIMWISCLMIAFIVPEMINSFVCFYKSKERPSRIQLLSVLIPETFHVIGITLMIFVILPEIDIMRFWLLCVWFVFDMGLLNLISRFSDRRNVKNNTVFIVGDVITLANLAITNIVFSLHDSTFYDNSFWIIILSSSFIFLGFWQDTSYSILSPTGYIRTFNTAREKLYPVRYYTYALASQWRVAVFLVSSFTILYVTGDNPVDIVLHFVDSFKQHNITLIENAQQKIVSNNGTIVDLGRVISIPDGSLSFVVLILLTQIFLSFLSNVEDDKGGLRILRGFDFRSRLGWNIPLSFSFVLVIWTLFVLDPYCNFNHHSIIPRFLSFDSRKQGLRKEISLHSQNISDIWKIIGSIISILWIGAHTIIRYYRLMVENKKPFSNENHKRPLFNRWLSSLKSKNQSNVEKELMTWKTNQEIQLNTSFNSSSLKY
ncbi:uncharacterized protein LOC130665811 [Microplitis mediator]|uniref:uncharacterized protein LOC130665811 n=1 Tax=Microplitis mediator TaxID=375433 RepID=UPI0025528773|nr:uncharacterized protein LOC130665811 [Microplitis mediator]